MDWSDERYVRIYTRDTADLLAVGWEGRLVWYEILRHANRAGRIDDADVDVLPDLLRIPREIVGVGLPRLIARGMVVTRNETSPSLVVRNFAAAQEAVASGRARQRTLREKRREIFGVGNEMPRISNETSPEVTRSNPVPCLAVPDRTVPSLDPPLSPQGGGADGSLEVEAAAPSTPRNGVTSKLVAEVAAEFCTHFNRQFAQQRKPAAWTADVKKALARGFTAAELRAACYGAANRCTDPDIRANFRPSTILRLTSREGKTTLPQWLEIAEDEWRRDHGAAPPPWSKT